MHRILPILLFSLVAIAAFSVWAFGSGLFRSEGGLYAICASVFLGLGGLALTPGQQLTGRRPRAAFALRFAAGFSAYALLWSVTWLVFRNTFGEIAGSFLGYLALAAILRPAIPETERGLIPAVALLFLWGTLGYYVGELAYSSLQNRGILAVALPLESRQVSSLAGLSWGLFYGLGLGYGLVSITHPNVARS